MDPVDYIRKILMVQGPMSLTCLLGYVKLCPSVAAIIGSSPEALRQLILNKSDEFVVKTKPSFTVENDLNAHVSRTVETVSLINNQPKTVVYSLAEHSFSKQECKEKDRASVLQENDFCDNICHVPCLENEFLALSHSDTFRCSLPGLNLNDSAAVIPNISSPENLVDEIEDWSYSRYEEIYEEAFPDPVAGFDINEHKPNLLQKQSTKSSTVNSPPELFSMTNAKAVVCKIHNKSCFAQLENQENVYIPLEAVAEAQPAFVKMADIVSIGLTVIVNAHVTENQRCRWKATKVSLVSSSGLLNEQRNEVGGVRTFIFQILEKFGRSLSVEKLFSLYQDTYSNYRRLFGDCEELLSGITNDNRFLVVQAEQKVYIRKDVESLALSFLLNTISKFGELSCETLEAVDEQALPSVREILGKDLVTGNYILSKLEMFCLNHEEILFVDGKIYRADSWSSCEFNNSCDKTVCVDYEVVCERYPGLRCDLPGTQISSFANLASVNPVNENIDIALDDLDIDDRQNEIRASFTESFFDSSLPKAAMNVSRLKDSDEESFPHVIIQSSLDYIRSNGPVKLDVLWEYIIASFKPEVVSSLTCFRKLIEQNEHLLFCVLNNKVYVKENVEEEALQFVIAKLKTVGPLDLGSLAYHLSSAAAEVQHLLQQKDGLNESNRVSADQMQIFLSRYTDRFILEGDTVRLANDEALCTDGDILDGCTSFEQTSGTVLDYLQGVQKIDETSAKETVSFKSQDKNDEIKSRLKLVKLKSTLNCEQCAEKKVEHFDCAVNNSLAPVKETVSNVSISEKDGNSTAVSVVKTDAYFADEENVLVSGSAREGSTKECQVIQDNVPQLFIPCTSSENLATSDIPLLSMQKNLFLASTLGSLEAFGKMPSGGLKNRDSSLNGSSEVSQDNPTAVHTVLGDISVDESSEELKGFVISYNSSKCILVLENGSVLSFTDFCADGSIFTCCEPALKKGSIIRIKKQVLSALISGYYVNATVESCCCTLSEFCWLGSVLAISHEAVYVRPLSGQLCEIPAAKWHSVHQCVNPGRHLVLGDVVGIKSDPGTKTLVIFAIVSGKNASCLDTKVGPVECCNENDIFFGRGIVRVLSSDFVSIQMASGEIASCLGNFLCQLHLEDTVFFSASSSADFVSKWKARDIRKELEHLLLSSSPSDDAKHGQYLNEMPFQSASTCAHSGLLTCDVASQTNSTGNIMTTRWYSGLGERKYNQL